MNFQLTDNGWDRILDQALRRDHSRIRIICPFIKEHAAHRLLRHGRPSRLQVITRFDLNGFWCKVSDVSALRLLLGAGAEIRGLKNLHAKAYLIGTRDAIITSANLTEQGLVRNHEFGFHAGDATIVAGCHKYFESLWMKTRFNLTSKRMDSWEQRLNAAAATTTRTPHVMGFGDEGEDAGFSSESSDTPDLVHSAEQGFVKFLGEGTNRAELSLPVMTELERSGCHWACAYPKSKRPKSVRNGAVMFMGRIMKGPVDIRVFGRAVGRQHNPATDNATAVEIKRHPWKKTWPRYIRVQDGEFVDGDMSAGVSLNAMMYELKENSFKSTQRNARKGNGNTNPRSAFRQQAAVELSPEAIAWLNLHLDRAFASHGKIASSLVSRIK
jgi:hypothetical protein